jgi:hypothetical protein
MWQSREPRYTVAEIEAWASYCAECDLRADSFVRDCEYGIAAVTKRNREAGA